MKKIKKYFSIYSAVVLMMNLTPMMVFAADDPLAVVNNLSNFMFSLIRAIGMIIAGYGIVQLGLGIQGHDTTSKSNGVLALAGGIIIMFAKEVLTLITG